MEWFYPVLWLALIILFVVLEASTVQLVSIWLAAGSLGCTDSRNAGNAFGSAGNCVRGGIRCLLGFYQAFCEKGLGS